METTGPREVSNPSAAPQARRLERVLSAARLEDPSDELAYWLSRPPEERVAHVEELRRMNYGDAYDAEGVRRVLEYARLEPR